ncbi:hypothetical protein ES707_18940 [subsurface metagenome]
MFKLSRQEEYLVLFLILAILIGSAVTLMKRLTPAPISKEELEHRVTPESVAASIFPEPGEAVPLGPRKIIIHITGAVNKPGVYQFNEGTRVIEAIKVAGGLKKGAIPGVLNLARPLVDGARIIVPQKFDVKAFRKKLLSYGPEHVYTTEELRLAYVEMEEGEREEKKGGKKEKKMKAAAAAGKININTASPAQLESLPGIGPKRAESIIANRPYSSPEEITKIHGFGPKIYQALKDMITAD